MGAVKHLFVIHFTLLVDNYCCFIAGVAGTIEHDPAELHSSLNFLPDEAVDLDNGAGRKQAVAVGGADLHSSPNFPPDEAVDGYYATSGLQWSAAVDLPSTFPVVDQTSPVTLLLSLKQCGLAPDTEILVSKAFLEELLESGTGLYICISLYFGLWCHIPA